MEKVIDKVKKLIALGTNDGATEGERDNAIRMAHGLLAKHNLTMMDIEESQGVVEGRVELFSQYQNVPWTGVVANSIAKLFFCFCYVEAKKPNVPGTGTKRKVYFIGKESNATTAVLMANYVIESIAKEKAKNKYSTSFCNGAATKIFQRVMDMIKAPEGATSSSTELAIVNIYKTEEQANKEFLGSKELVTKKSKSRVNNVDDYYAGSAYGASINLNNQLSGNSNKTQRLN